MFANLREAAGTARAEFPGATVGEVLDAASAAYGADFAAGLGVANVWVNGDTADLDTAVGPSDEIALIPPVSGGAPTLTDEATPVLLAVILLATFLIANVVSPQALALAAVGGAMAWLWDLTDTLAARRLGVAAIPALLGTAAAGNAAYRWGVAGLAGGIALGVMLVLVWPLFDARYRDLQAMGAAGLMVVTAGGGAGALILARIESAVNVAAFLAIMLCGAVAAWLARSFLPEVQGVDPNLAAALGALVGAMVVAVAAASLETAATLVAAAAAVAGWFAGRVIGSLLRSGDVEHTTRGPGLLTAIDGVVVGAAGFWIGLLLLGG